MNNPFNDGPPFRFFVERRIHYGDFALHCGRQLQNGSVEVMRSITSETMPPGTYMGDPLMRLKDEEVQSLMDELWNAGVRPANTVSSVGHLAAIEKHLEDMRALAFNSLKAPKP